MSCYLLSFIKASFVQTLDRAIHWIKISPVDNAIDLRTTPQARVARSMVSANQR